ncbi:unnamed protein product [Rotaria sordida]|uniref:Late endosomal/lysosomal adaptor and MAPK and MTOR activator 5 n=1 Tax=Rotaria sordida TaxID=392033 RepID=A0A814JSV9_9BILA|nr:unnamed protein product [Rotaria sordida]CAF0919125.1 unnamed protein product [Rotaria sordida]CAF0935570.1 unnamed protein product [Rotaria sordida]CAF1001451.1 unnamed protein product [Rotaria sordida]CAF1042592.1 unnamed protein product [Rotaria sordida]
MDKKFDGLIDNAIEKFTMIGGEIQGILVCDKNGLPLANKDVSISPGPIALLAQFAESLSGRRTTICLEHNEAQVLIQPTDKTVVAVYTKQAT